MQLASPTGHAGKHVTFSPLLVNTYRSCPDCFLIEAKARAGFGAGTGTSGGRVCQHWDLCCTHIKSFSFRPNRKILDEKRLSRSRLTSAYMYSNSQFILSAVSVLAHANRPPDASSRATREQTLAEGAVSSSRSCRDQTSPLC